MEETKTKTVSAMNNISLDIRDKQKFTINGDPNRFVELNTGDMGITSRYAGSIPKFNEWIKLIEELGLDIDSDESMAHYNKTFEEAERTIRELVDYVFDYPVSEVCGSSGSMFDMCEGKFRFEVILETLFRMYDKTISTEMKKLQKRMKSHTDKYMPQDHRKKS